MGLFGLETKRESSKLIIIPAPWDVTTSYSGGTYKGPEAILQASPQIDLYDIEFKEAWKKGFHLESVDNFFQANEETRQQAKSIIDNWDEFGDLSESAKNTAAEVNAKTSEMVATVNKHAKSILNENKIPALIGGDHSTPQGLIEAVGEHYKGDFCILHIDAHADLRVAYQGFTHSHASIMYNVMSSEFAPKKLVQVGIRDFCKEEYEMARSDKRIESFYDNDIKTKLFDGKSWRKICDKIIKELPKNVYVSFDIDGMSPEFCPHTGTPVPGGLSFDQVTHLLSTLGHSGKKIVGFDLNEVAPGENSEWDGNVGSRVLYKLCGWTVTTNA